MATYFLGKLFAAHIPPRYQHRNPVLLPYKWEPGSPVAGDINCPSAGEMAKACAPQLLLDKDVHLIVESFGTFVALELLALQVPIASVSFALFPSVGVDRVHWLGRYAYYSDPGNFAELVAKANARNDWEHLRQFHRLGPRKTALWFECAAALDPDPSDFDPFLTVPTEVLQWDWHGDKQHPYSSIGRVLSHFRDCASQPGFSGALPRVPSALRSFL